MAILSLTVLSTFFKPSLTDSVAVFCEKGEVVNGRWVAMTGARVAERATARGRVAVLVRNDMISMFLEGKGGYSLISDEFERELVWLGRIRRRKNIVEDIWYDTIMMVGPTGRCSTAWSYPNRASSIMIHDVISTSHLTHPFHANKSSIIAGQKLLTSERKSIINLKAVTKCQ